MVEEYIFDMMHGVETGFCFEEHCSRLHLIVEDRDSFVHSYLNFMEDVLGGVCIRGTIIWFVLGMICKSYVLSCPVSG